MEYLAVAGGALIIALYVAAIADIVFRHMRKGHRFNSTKDILTLLIPVLGPIFYFFGRQGKTGAS